LNDAEFLAIIYLEMNKRLGLKNIIYMNSKWGIHNNFRMEVNIC
jgi:hypothetical protein